MKLVLLALAGSAWVALFWWRPTPFLNLWRRLERALARLARRAPVAIGLVFVLALGIQAGLAAWLGIAPPHIHDEFANLLAADTFAHGRLANPTHPLWPFFEAIHVLSEPAYVAKYPPATGLMLAVGQVALGLPAAGMWLSVALTCAAIAWALRAWLPARWALLGGLLATFHPVLLKWGQVYWGGAEAMLGGALLVGAYGRIIRKPGILNAGWLGLGLVLLAISRPFEGMVLALVVLGHLAVWLVQNRRQLPWQSLLKLMLPITTVLGLYAGGQILYNWRITGQPLKMPYLVYEEQYAVAPFLVWQKARPIPPYQHEFLRRHFVDYALEEYQRQQTLPGLLRETMAKCLRLARAYLWGFVLAVPLLAWPWMVRRRKVRFLVVAAAIFGGALLMETWMGDRYAAPIGAVFFGLVAQGFRHLRRWRCGGRPAGVLLILMVLAGAAAQNALWLKNRRWEYARHDWDWQRARMIRELRGQGGQHLVVVRYGPQQSVHNDWVHNDADLDAAPVVWARDMGAAKNRALLDYYRGRKLWLLEVENPWEQAVRDLRPAKLIPYPDPGPQIPLRPPNVPKR